MMTDILSQIAIATDSRTVRGGNSSIRIELSIDIKIYLIAQVRIRLQCRRPQFNSWVRKMCWRRDRLPTPVFSGFPCGSAGKESACNAGGLGSIPGLGRSPGEGKGYPLQYSGLENSVDYIVLWVAKGQTLLSNFHFAP